MAEYEWKPVIEETWSAVYDDVYSDDGHPGDDEFDRVLAFEGAIGVDKGAARVKLAAAAPEMARLLLWAKDLPGDEREWLFSDDERRRIEVVLQKAGVIAS